MLLTAENLSKNYGMKQLLDNVSLYLNAGDRIGLIGVNGTGKSSDTISMPAHGSKTVRIAVGGKTRFACVDGPEFDGHEIDFDEAIARSSSYRDFERHAYEETCNLFKGVK